MIRTLEFRAMNTNILVAAEGERAMDGMYAAQAFINECEQRFSRFLPGSELSALNHSDGDWFHTSIELMEMLRLSMDFHVRTNGLFDPSILTDLKRIGYDRSMDDIRSAGGKSPAPASTRRPGPAFREIEFDPARSLVRLPPGMEIDLGGIAKGWIVKKTAQLLNGYSRACAVSAGGDMQFIGYPSDATDWEVVLEDPRDPSLTLAQLHVGPGAVATSSVRKRTWSQGDKARHHLVDPRTGESANTDWLSVTVIARDIITAEVYAKAILIGGEGELAALVKSGPKIAYIAVDPNGNLLGSPGFKEFMHEGTKDSVQSVGIPS